MVQECSQKFSCDICDYHTSRISQYNRHLLTRKHETMVEYQQSSTQKFQNVPKSFTCECGKIYKERTGLWRHKQQCTHTNHNACVDIHNSPAAIVELLRQNQEFKQLMIDQNRQMQETQVQLQQSYAQNNELQHQMVEMFKEGKTINNNNNTSNKFNLNFFLNDTCKDAISITDFLRNLNVHIDELEYIGNHGYVNGMTKMIMARLKDMDITKRPIHCTDIKRETMYIKDDAGWSKDTDELSKLRKILSRISMNNYRTVPVWRTAHPDCEVMESRNYEFCYKMMRAILGDVEDEQIKLDNKIIKTMAKELFVNKTT